MATKSLADLAIDRSKSYERKRRASEKKHKRRERNQGQYSRVLEIAINLYDYIQNTPGMSRALLAEKLNVSQAYICNLINGKLNPSIKTIEKYERILSVSLLPAGEIENETSIISQLPRIKVMSTEFFKEDEEVNNQYVVYANQFPILTY